MESRFVWREAGSGHRVCSRGWELDERRRWDPSANSALWRGCGHTGAVKPQGGQAVQPQAPWTPLLAPGPRPSSPTDRAPAPLSLIPSLPHLLPALSPAEPAVACRRNGPCHGCLQCVIVSVTLQIPFPCRGPSGVITRRGHGPVNKQNPSP